MVWDTRRGFWLGTRSTLLILCDPAWLSPPAYTARLRSPCSLWPPPSCVLVTHTGVLPGGFSGLDTSEGHQRPFPRSWLSLGRGPSLGGSEVGFVLSPQFNDKKQDLIQCYHHIV